MNIKTWIGGLFCKQKKLKKTAPVEEVFVTELMQKEVVGLNFKSAVEAHQNWKKRLKTVVDGTSAETLLVETVSRDDQCLLGKWIYSDGGEKFASLEQFVRLKNNHAQFHVCAGHVLHLAQAGNHDDALQELSDGEYARVSREVIRDLVSVHTHAVHKSAA